MTYDIKSKTLLTKRDLPKSNHCAKCNIWLWQKMATSILFFIVVFCITHPLKIVVLAIILVVILKKQVELADGLVCAYADEGLFFLISISFYASFGSGADNYWELALCLKLVQEFVDLTQRVITTYSPTPYFFIKVLQQQDADSLWLYAVPVFR